MRIKFTVQGKTIQEVIREIDKKQKEIKNDITNIGNESLNFLKGYIDSQRERAKSPHEDTNKKASKQSLVKTMDIDNFQFGWGIGNIDKLNQYSPHWAFINFGGTPPSTRDYPHLYGHFNEGGLFVKGEPWHPIYPTRYAGIDYIETTRRFIINKLRKYSSKR